ncbi:DUF6950 family protein [Hyphomicrobium sp. MC8b]|jgi:NlpC/P60 family putative phage cell wall peptidase|uniref:DUF6950 family protein n=1 Tax=Hyphomicrobium sp. MC8b TaxID=300273 RepID=UPI00391DDD21
MNVLTRDGIVVTARRWIGTPYHHQASVCGIGADCLGLVRGVWRDLYGNDAEAPPVYSRDWAETSGCEAMLEAAERHLKRVPIAEARGGDVVVFRLREGCVAKHAGILTSAWTMVHAMEGAAAIEITLTPWWRRRIAGMFQFPGVV